MKMCFPFFFHVSWPLFSTKVDFKWYQKSSGYWKSKTYLTPIKADITHLVINLIIYDLKSTSSFPFSLKQFYLRLVQALSEINHSFFTNCLYAIMWHWHELVRTRQLSVTKTTSTAFPRRDGRSTAGSSPQAQTVLSLTWATTWPLTTGLTRCGHRMSIWLFDLFQQQVLKKGGEKKFLKIWNCVSLIMSKIQALWLHKPQPDRKMNQPIKLLFQLQMRVVIRFCWL